MNRLLDKLISFEEKKVDELYKIRYELASKTGKENSIPISLSKFRNQEEVERELEKAHTQLSIYKIQKMMGFEFSRV